MEIPKKMTSWRVLRWRSPILATATSAHAGGLFVPGSGAISTSRAGAAVASVDDGEALSSTRPASRKREGLKLTISATLIQYYMSFTRRGTYDPIDLDDSAVRGPAPTPTVENDPKPPLGIGKFQPLPVIVVSSDLGGRVPSLTIARRPLHAERLSVPRHVERLPVPDERRPRTTTSRRRRRATTS